MRLLARVLFLEDRAAANDAALPSPPCASSTVGPPNGERIGGSARFGIVLSGVRSGNLPVATVVTWLAPRHPRSSGPAVTIEPHSSATSKTAGGSSSTPSVPPRSPRSRVGSTKSHRWPTARAECSSTSSAPIRGPCCAGVRTSCPSTPACALCCAPAPSSTSPGALLGEPAVLYKEKVNYKLPGGAGYSPHQDAPAYPMIDVHVSAMVAVDDADESNGGLELVSRCFDAVLPLDERGCIEASVVEAVGVAARAVARGPHTLVPQSNTTPQRPQPLRSTPPSPLPHLQRRE